MNQDELTTGDTPDAIGQETKTIDQQAPRLRIHHLMLWSLCAAPLLTVFKTYQNTQGFDSEYQTLLESFYIVQGTLGGALLAGTLVMIHAKLRKQLPLFRQPGHWFLFVHALTLVVWTIVGSLAEQQFSNTSLNMLLYAGVYIIPAGVYLFAARSSTVLRWRIIFAGRFLINLVHCMHFTSIALAWDTFALLRWYSIVELILSILILILDVWLVAAIVIDKRLGLRRDWLHWIGVVGILTQAVLNLVWRVSFWLIDYL